MVEEILDFCAEEFGDSGDCEDCEVPCQADCYGCLQDIHRRSGERYRCENSTYCYVCKYLPKYTSEIEILLNSLESEISEFERFQILGLGCGPCSDLWSFINFNSKSESYKDIRYFGYDLNDKWDRVINKTREIVADIEDFNVRLLKIDRDVSSENFFQEIRQRHLERANFVILQYLISDMVKNGYNIRSFMDRLYHDLIVNLRLGSFIIVNDINHNRQARDHFVPLLEVIRSNAPDNYNIRMYHFRNRFKDYTYEYGQRHAANRLTMEVPETIIDTFEPINGCSSAQLVIRKIR